MTSSSGDIISIDATSSKMPEERPRPLLYDTVMVTILCKGNILRPSRLRDEMTDEYMGVCPPVASNSEEYKSCYDVFSLVHRTFQVQKTLACAYSHYLRTSFTTELIKGESQAVTLYANPDVCNLMIRWLYTQSLDDEDDDGNPIPRWHLLDLWLLADFLLMPGLQNDAMDAYLQSWVVDEHCSWILEWVWKSTANNGNYHPLRRVLVEEYALLEVGQAMSMLKDMPREMLGWVWENLVRKRQEDTCSTPLAQQWWKLCSLRCSSCFYIKTEDRCEKKVM